MAGSALQTISGSGIWALTSGNAGTGVFTGLGINNTSGLNPAVQVNQNIALQNLLNLTTGILGGSGTLTFGNATASTLTTNITNGSLSMTNPTAFNLTGVTYNVNYNIAAATQTTGAELPPTTYSFYKLG